MEWNKQTYYFFLIAFTVYIVSVLVWSLGLLISACYTKSGLVVAETIQVWTYALIEIGHCVVFCAILLQSYQNSKSIPKKDTEALEEDTSDLEEEVSHSIVTS